MREPHPNQAVIRFIVGQMVITVMLVIVVWAQGYYGRRDLVDSQRAGCERGKADRIANAKAWRTAADRARSQGQPFYAVKYDAVALGLENRSYIVCADAFPYPSVLP